MERISMPTTPQKTFNLDFPFSFVPELKALGKSAEHPLWNRIYSMDLSTSIVGSKVLSIPVIWLPGLLLLGLAVWWLRMPKKVANTMDNLCSLGEDTKIVPAEPFDLSLTKPPRFWPFKPNYHLTMGIESLDPQDLLLFDQTYLERLPLRQSLLREHPEDVIGITDSSNERIRLAVQELYNYLFQTYLPSRYPSQFRLCSERGSHMVENTMTHQAVAVKMDDSTTLRKALSLIAENIDEDFFILLPHEQDNGHGPQEVYILEAYAACFPSGFKPRDKIGKRLADIHAPVPGYKEKLEKSMDRFFARLETGRLVKRINWSLTVDEELHSNFDKGGIALEGKLEHLSLEDLDLDKTFVRCERQTLHRLPQSKAIVFAFHTYLYPIRDVKAAGCGEDLATAIDGLQNSKIPRIFTYKNGDKWADAVRQFLRR